MFCHGPFFIPNRSTYHWACQTLELPGKERPEPTVSKLARTVDPDVGLDRFYVSTGFVLKALDKICSSYLDDNKQMCKLPRSIIDFPSG